MIVACSLVLPAPSSSQRRGRAKKGQTAVKSEEEDMQAGPSTSQPDSASQQEAEMGPSQQEAEMEVAAVLTAGVDLTEDADETAVPLLDRIYIIHFCVTWLLSDAYARLLYCKLLLECRHWHIFVCKSTLSDIHIMSLLT